MPDLLGLPIVPPRVALTDPRSGIISREWYMFFLSLFQSTGGSSISLDDIQKYKPSLTIDDVAHIIGRDDGNLTPIPSISELQIAFDAIRQDLQMLPVGDVPYSVNKLIEDLTPTSNLSELQAAFDSIHQELRILPQQEPPVLVETAPVTKTTDFVVGVGEKWLINNKSGSSCTVTLPSASRGRELHFQNYQAQTLVSASSNVVPLAGGAAGTAILGAVAGANATLVSDGTNWIIVH